MITRNIVAICIGGMGMIIATLLALASPSFYSSATDDEICANVTSQIASLNKMIASVEAESDRSVKSEPSKVDCSAKVIKLNAQSEYSGAEAREFVKSIEANPEGECEGFSSFVPLLDRGWRLKTFTRFEDGTTYAQDLSCKSMTNER